MPRCRTAVVADAESIASAHVASWKAAYRGLLPDEYLDALSVDDRLPWWRTILATPEDERVATTFVVEDDGGQVRGFATAQLVSAAEGQLNALYLEPGAWGLALGRRLHEHALDALCRWGARRALLWVHPGNVRARRFYERAGWCDDGVEVHGEVWGLEVPELRYSLVLSDGSGGAVAP